MYAQVSPTSKVAAVVLAESTPRRKPNLAAMRRGRERQLARERREAVKRWDDFLKWVANGLPIKGAPDRIPSDSDAQAWREAHGDR